MNGIAVLTYDKRGVGESQGECCPSLDPGYFELLGEDVLAGARQIATHPEIDSRGIGAWGFSQSGWVVPVAAARGGSLLSWMIVGSGPTVSLGEELLYSDLTGDDRCEPSGLSAEEIERRLNEAGPSGFDPRPFLAQTRAPGKWIFGALDTSIPVERSVRIIEGLAAEGKDYTAVVLPRMNHSWIVDGAMCQTTGPGGIPAKEVIDWLRPRLEAAGVWRPGR